MRVRIRVRPSATGTAAGGSYDESLVVRVRERAADGRATAAALAALAKALAVRADDVRLISGARSRTKVVDIPDSAARRFNELLES
jgi:uncharacterized protein YggU (UPF0235/DUF167 family)